VTHTPRPEPPRRPAPSAETATSSRQDSGADSVALVLGLLAAGTALSGALFTGRDWLGWAGIALGLLAIVPGFLGSRRAFHDPERSGGTALGGLALGVVGVAVGAWLVVPVLFGFGTFGQGLTLDECLAQSQGQQQERMCASQHLDEYKARYGDPGTVGNG
jgi:hypothetical protein